MKPFLGLMLLLALCGCNSAPERKSRRAETTPALKSEFRREHQFTRNDRRQIRIARRGIRESGKQPRGGSDDAFYRIRQDAKGCEVFVIYVTGYENSQPTFTPCVHNAVRLTGSGLVQKVLVGPECWP